MILFPAIDIKDGQCVRLYQGDYAQMTVYATDPVEVAHRWQDAGASWLHVVDLDGSKDGHPVNAALIKRICQETHLQVEIGGGMRSMEIIEQALSWGVKRVVLGTAVLTNKPLLEQALQSWPEQVVVGLDARAGQVAIHGWQETSSIRASELARELSAAGARHFVYTDIGRDAAMRGPNLEALQEMLDALKNSSATLIASGGVSSLDDLRELAKLDVEGAIIGKALYVGAIDLAEAVREIEQAPAEQRGKNR